jgi:hypothetical protein
VTGAAGSTGIRIEGRHLECNGGVCIVSRSGRVGDVMGVIGEISEKLLSRHEALALQYFSIYVIQASP